MTKLQKVLVAIGFAGAFLIGFAAYHAPIQALAAQLYHTSFDRIAPTNYGGTSVGAAGAQVIFDTNSNRQYLSLDNSGAVGVSCFPASASNGSTTYGGGWWLSPNGGSISFDSVTIYGDTVWCLTGSGTTTVGWVER